MVLAFCCEDSFFSAGIVKQVGSYGEEGKKTKCKELAEQGVDAKN